MGPAAGVEASGAQHILSADRDEASAVERGRWRSLLYTVDTFINMDLALYNMNCMEHLLTRLLGEHLGLQSLERLVVHLVEVRVRAP